MREIKFRCYDDIAKEMFNLNTLWLDLKYKDRFHIMQYTGLKDKNGVEIYSKDLVRQSSNLFRIEPCVGGFECVVLKELKNGGYVEGSTYDFSALSDKYCEVIGNIYEHSNLLNNE